MKKEILFPKWREGDLAGKRWPQGCPESGPGEPQLSLSPLLGGIWGSLEHKEGLPGHCSIPLPPAKPGKNPQTPLKNPGPAVRARREPKGLRQRLSSTFWKGKTLWIRFNFPAMTWKGERRGGETYPGFSFPPPLWFGEAVWGSGWAGRDPLLPSTPSAPPGHPSTPCSPTPALGASGNGNSDG